MILVNNFLEFLVTGSDFANNRDFPISTLCMPKSRIKVRNRIQKDIGRSTTCPHKNNNCTSLALTHTPQLLRRLNIPKHRMVPATVLQSFLVRMLVFIYTFCAVKYTAIVAVVILMFEFECFETEITLSCLFVLCLPCYFCLGEDVALKSHHLVVLRTFLGNDISTLKAIPTLLALLPAVLLLISPSASKVTTISFLVKSSNCIIISKVGPNNPLSNS